MYKARENTEIKMNKNEKKNKIEFLIRDVNVYTKITVYNASVMVKLAFYYYYTWKFNVFFSPVEYFFLLYCIQFSV